MRTACLFVGMAAIGLSLEVGAIVGLLGMKWSWLPQTVTILGALFIAWRLVLKPPLAERWQGPDGMAWAIAGAGAVAIAFWPDAPWRMTLAWRIGFRAAGIFELVAGLALLALFAKLAYDTPREEASDGTLEPPTIRVFLATWIILIGMVVVPVLGTWASLSDDSLMQAIEELKALLSGDVSMLSMLSGWAIWIGAGVAAWYLLARFAVIDRIPADRPGVGLLSWGVALTLAVSLLALVLSLSALRSAAGGGGGGNILVALIGFAVIAGPVAVLGYALTFVGLFRMLSNLEPEYVEDADSDGGDAVPTAKPAAPAPAPAAAPAASAALAPATTVAEARAQLAMRPNDALLHQQLHKLLLADPAAGADLAAHARDYIALLVKQSRGDQALAILKTCLQKNPAFRPHPDQVLPLANLVMAHGDPMLALRLMHEFDRLNPGHAATAGVLYLSARVLRSQNKFVPAARILDHLLQRFPNDALIPQARSLREALERLITAPPANPKPA